MADDMSALAEIGHNNPPEPSPYEAVTAHIEDLLAEAHNWADGTTVETQAQADEASRLIDDLRKAAKVADEKRVEEKKPLDEAIAEIQARWNVYIADPKTKHPGKVWKAIDALKACVKPFLDKLEAERRAAAEKARQEAEEAARRAAEAARAAASSDLAAQEEAEELVMAAEQAQAVAKRIENSKAQARGGERALGLRKVYRAVMVDRKAALIHYAATQPEALVTFLQGLADADVRRAIRTIPGFEVREETVL
jgi:hypothetical protein